MSAAEISSIGTSNGEVHFLDPNSPTPETEHWEHLWVNNLFLEDEYTRQHARDFVGGHGVLMDIVARGAIDPSQFANNSTLFSVTSGIPESVGSAANTLYRQLGAENTMYRGSGVLVALAGRLINEAIDVPIIRQASYDEDFFSDRLQNEHDLPETTMDLIDTIQPFEDDRQRRKWLYKLLRQADAQTLVPAIDILHDAANAAEDAELQTLLRQSILVLMESVEARNALTETEDQIRLTSYRHDITFAELAKQGADHTDYLSVFNTHSHRIKKLLAKAPTGRALELFMPLLARHLAWHGRTINEIEIRHATLRSDIPYNRRDGVAKDYSLPNKSYDTQVIDHQSGTTTNIQLKARADISHRNYDLASVTVF